MSQTRAQLVKGFSNTSASDDAVTVDSSGNVGIGTSSIASGGSNTTNFNVHTPSSTSVYLKLSNSGTGNTASDAFDLSADSSGNAYLINRENGNMTFWTNATERMRILAAGGLTFNGDTAAANALDDYEEGDWTPDLQFGGAKVGITYANQYGKYVKIGRLVHVFGRITLSSKGSSGGIARFFGLPYVTETITGTTMNIGSIWYSGFNLQGSIVQVVMRTDGNGNSFVEPKGVTTNTEDSIGDSDFTNTTDMCFSVTYRTT